MVRKGVSGVKLQSGQKIWANGGRPTDEEFADEFGLSFLMPHEELSKRSFWGVRRLAHFFGVPTEIVHRRMQQLGIWVAALFLISLLPVTVHADSIKPIDWGVSAIQAPSSWGPSMIAGAGIGYGVSGPDRRELFTIQYAGLRVLALEGAATYACYQHGMVEGTEVGGNGARLIFVSGWRQVPDFSWLMGIGFLDHIQELRDSTLDVGMTWDGGLSYSPNDWLELAIYAFAWDRGPRFSWALTFSMAIKDPQRLIPGL